MEPNPRSSSPILKTPPKGRSSIGSSKKSAYEEERYDQLLKEFSRIDKDKNNSLSFEEILNFLSEKQNEEFDFILCQEIFARLDKNNDSVVTLEEFVESYVEVESLIIKKIRSLNKEIMSNTRQLMSNQEKLRVAERTEVLNSVGIMQDSVLTVLVKSAQNLLPSTAMGQSNPYVLIECQEFKEKTTVKNGLHPVWDEVFVIPIASKGLQLSLTVMSDNISGVQFLGNVKIPLISVLDQLKHEQFFPLLNINGENKTQGKILLEIQWIWSKVRYLQTIVSDWEKVINEDNETVESLQVQLEKLRKPFAYLSENTNNYEISSPGISLQFEGIKHEPIKTYKFEEVFVVRQGKDTRFFLLLFFLVVIGFVNFARPDFFSVIFK